MSHSDTVVVVAAGAAGLCAAIAAAQAGARVQVFEKAATTGGTANRGMGPLGIESRHTRQRQLRPTRDEAFKAFMNYTHWRVDAALVRAYLNRSGDTIHWLETLGVEFTEPASYFVEAYPTWHLVKPEEGPPGPGGAATMMRVLTRKAEALGVAITLGTPVTRLVRNGDAVTGVAVGGPDREREVPAGAVIVATGGFGDNPAMIAEQFGYQWGRDLYSFRIPGIAGDGLRMAWEAGAQPTEMGLELIYGMPDGISIPPPLHEACRQPHLMVNKGGERFMDEAVMGNVTFTANAIARQQDRAGHLVFDSTILAGMEDDLDFRNRVFPVTRIERPAELIAALRARDYPHFFVADTLEALADRAGIDPAGLARTVAAYNADCARGYDQAFAKDRRYLRPLMTGPFYAARHFPSAYGTLGGIKIDARTRVIDCDWRVIPGFYAAGTDACAIHGDSYVFILPGNSMGFAVNTGRIAGEQAAAYVGRT
ncbi:FAD-dependent oxidoreductase [Sphingomonas sp.]|jgi:fumarate reductase flavoprotein subunit|uniref:FAD-dependent oxidoreductase n=1 Tax=Sphingomonas sp. TaxID=28214 RepID=UPI002D7EC30A|nr:FAD-binding protein [Sphingomonas sp.]HEU0045397.1 FAD-binding protein [Sphingomonas sp.]